MTSKFTFGTSPAVAATTSGGLFGNVSTATTSISNAPAQPTGLFTATSNAQQTSGFFEAAAKTQTAGGVLGSATETPRFPPSINTTAVAGSLFDKPTTDIFSAAAATTTAGGIFGVAPTTSLGIGLGGTGSLTAGGYGGKQPSSGVAGPAASGDPMEVEVPQMLIELVSQLKQQLKKNQEMIDEFAMNSNDGCLKMEGKLDEIKKLRVQNSEVVRNTRAKSDGLLHQVKRDVRASEQVQRRQKEMIKNRNYGRKQSFDYLLTTCGEYEQTVQEFFNTLQLFEIFVESKLNRSGKKADRPQILSRDDLVEHLKRYDQVFKAICSDVYQCNVGIQDLKEVFMEHRKRIMPYTANPFDKKRHEDNVSAQTRFTGADAFPSLVTMMKIGELARASAPAQQTATASSIGAGGLFGSKPFATPFSFNPAVGTSGQLFKPFGAAATTAASSLFGNTVTTTVASNAAPAFAFGNTISSNASGILFGGAASKPFGR